MMDKGKRCSACNQDLHLAKCPFCASQKVRLYRAKSWLGDSWYVGCEYCHAKGPLSRDREVAAKEWNRRP